MSKKFLAVTLAMAFMASAASVTFAKVTCEVKDVKDNTVTLECKDASKLKVGGEVTVKPAKKKAIEGC